MSTLRSWLTRRGFHMHAQNLDRDGKGSMWREGRAWLRYYDHEDTRWELNPSWSVLPRSLGAGIGIEVGGGDSSRELQLHAGTPLLWLWLTIDGLPRSFCERVLPGRWHEWDDARGVHHRSKITDAQEVSLSIHSDALWWSLWHSTMEWSSSTPRWRHGSWSPVDWLLGSQRYSRQQIGEPRQALIPMPEGAYPATFTPYVQEWRRPRWPRVLRREYTEIDIPGGVPVPGKGENSWDCGEDAIMSTGADGHRIEHAIARVVESAMRDRLRYGGRDWRPAPKAAVS